MTHRFATGGVAIFLAIAFGEITLAQHIDEDTVTRIDQAYAAQERDLKGYTRHEKYLLFRGDNEAPSASILVNVTYDRDKGKTFTVISETGSELLRKNVLQRVVDEQKYLAQPDNRQQISVTSSNYGFKNGTDKDPDQRECFRYDVTPKENSIYLLDGHAWFDKQKFSLLKISGQQARSPSIWVGRAMITRTYDLVDGFTLAKHVEATSHRFLFGTTTVKIEYSDYSVTH